MSDSSALEERIISLKDAAAQISDAQTLDLSRRPFFFLVGAGISKPPVPAASEIEAKCREQVQRQKKKVAEQPGATDMERYSFWLRQAFPFPANRQQYIQSLIADKSISRANFHLAHLLSQTRLANIVVTPNFDDFLTRALIVLIKPPIVCDHPATAWRIDPEKANLQILHVHGIYLYYDMKNLGAELESARQDQRLQAKLDDVLSRSSPIVLGYSGWAGDAIMTALRKRLEKAREIEPLSVPWFWFCYQRKEIERLPDWLKQDSNVYFVAPDAPPAPGDPAAQGAAAPPAVQALGLTTPKLSDPDSKNGDRYTQPADKVLWQLIESCQADTPALLKDSLGSLAQHLYDSFLKDGGSDHDPYRVGSVIERIKRAKELFEADEKLKVQEVTVQADKALDASRRAQHREAAAECSKITDYNRLDAARLKDLMDAMWTAAKGLYDNSDEELAAYDLTIRLGDLLRTRDNSDPALDVLLAKALYNKSGTYSIRGQAAESDAAAADLLSRFNDATDPELVLFVVATLTNLAVQHYEAAAQAAERDAGLRVALDDIEAILNRFGAATEPSIREYIALNLRNKGVILRELDKYLDNIANSDAAYQEVLTRFGNETGPAFLDSQAGAYNGLGFNNLCKAKQRLVKGDKTGAEQLLRQALTQFEQTLTRKPDWPVALGNQGYAAFLLGDVETARTALTQALKVGGEEVRQVELKDSEFSPVPKVDDEFRALLNSLTVPAPEGPAA